MSTHTQRAGASAQAWPVPVGGLQEEGPLKHLLSHMHIVLAPDGHGVGLPAQVPGVVVYVALILAQLGKVVELDGGRGPEGHVGPCWLSSGGA